MALQTPGFWQDTFYADSFWQDAFWQDFGISISDYEIVNLKSSISRTDTITSGIVRMASKKGGIFLATTLTSVIQ